MQHISKTVRAPTNLQNLPKGQAIAGQRTVKLLVVLNDAHSHINDQTVQIANPTPLLFPFHNS